MSLSSITRRNDYTGNGSVSVYSYSFRIFSQTDLEVRVKKISDGTITTLTITTDYTVSGVGSSSGGNVTLVSSGQAWLTAGKLSSSYTITIRRVVSLVQNTDIRNQGAFFAGTHEDAFDYLTMIDQQQQDDIDRSMKLADTIPATDFDMTLPGDIEDHPSEAIVVNDDGDGLTFRSVLTGSPDFFIQATSPTNPSSTSVAFWYDTSVSQMKIWVVSAWQVIA